MLMIPVSIPYYAPANELPSALPTAADIEGSGEVLKDESATKVVAVGPHFVVKYGESLNLQEGRTMIFIQRHTQVPVPRVFALYKHNGQNFIVMERIHGQTLKEIWHTLEEPQKEVIVAKMKEYLGQMRKIESPGGYCSLDNQPLFDPMFLTPLQVHGGPYDSEAALNDALIQNVRSSDALKNKAEFYEQALPTIFRDHPPVLTHGDIQKKNIMIRTGSTPEIVLLDWESAGWYPSYWEYANTIYAGWFESDWYCWIPQFLEPYLNEYAWFAMLAHEIGW